MGETSCFLPQLTPLPLPCPCSLDVCACFCFLRPAPIALLVLSLRVRDFPSSTAHVCVTRSIQALHPNGHAEMRRRQNDAPFHL